MSIKQYVARFKCRMCGRTDIKEDASKDDSGLLSSYVSDVGMIEPVGKKLHKCSESQIGVCDLTGYEVKI